MRRLTVCFSMYSLMSMRTSASSVLNRYDASAFASSVCARYTHLIPYANPLTPCRLHAPCCAARQAAARQASRHDKQSLWLPLDPAAACGAGATGSGLQAACAVKISDALGRAAMKILAGAPGAARTLPTPVGPRNMKLAMGRLGSDSPARDLRRSAGRAVDTAPRRRPPGLCAGAEFQGRRGRQQGAHWAVAGCFAQATACCARACTCSCPAPRHVTEHGTDVSWQPGGWCSVVGQGVAPYCRLIPIHRAKSLLIL